MGGFLMASLIPSGSASGTGSVTLTVPTTNNNQTATLPDATGTVMVSGNMPTFRAHNTSTQSISTSVWTKVAYQAEDWDTANAFDSTTNYRFTPLVAGYYQVNGSALLDWGGAVGGSTEAIAIYKNGSAFSTSGASYASAIGPYGALGVSDIVYLNGSTDYIEIYVNSNAPTSPTVDSSVTGSRFSASLIRSA